MSLFGKIGSALKKAVKSPILGALAPLVPGVGGVIAGIQRNIGTVGPAVAAPSRAGPTIRLPPVGSPVMGGSMIPNIGGILRTAGSKILPRVIPGAGRVAAGAGALIRGGKGLVAKYPRSARVLAELGLVAVGGLVFDAAGNFMGRRAPARRINPCNAKAARRACRRLKATHRLLQEIERQLPRRVVHAPAGGGFKRKRKC